MNAGRGTEEIAVEELARFKHDVRFVSRDSTKNRERFYLLRWQGSLHGDTALVCTWGRIGTQGRSRILCFESAPDMTRLERLMRRRLQRGYHVTEWS